MSFLHWMSVLGRYDLEVVTEARMIDVVQQHLRPHAFVIGSKMVQSHIMKGEKGEKVEGTLTEVVKEGGPVVFSRLCGRLVEVDCSLSTFRTDKHIYDVLAGYPKL